MNSMVISKMVLNLDLVDWYITILVMYMMVNL